MSQYWAVVGKEYVDPYSIIVKAPNARSAARMFSRYLNEVREIFEENTGKKVDWEMEVIDVYRAKRSKSGFVVSGKPVLEDMEV